MAPLIVETPRANANEDQLQVIACPIAVGQAVDAGDLLFVLETTKAAVEVAAPVAGVVTGLHVAVGDFVKVGDGLCEISAGTDTPAAVDNVLRFQVGTVAVTAKARRLAAELGLDLAAINPTAGRIGAADVQAASRALPLAGGEPSARAARTGVRRALIVGGGGHAACLIDALQGSGYAIEGCIDRRLPVGSHVTGGVRVCGDEGALPRLRAEGVAYAFVGVGGAADSVDRLSLFEQLSGLGFELPAIIHRSAIVAADVTIGRGVHVLAGASIGARCAIGDNVIVNQGTIVCHDCTIHDHVHLTPGAILAGGVEVGPRSVIGMGVTILLGVTVGADCLIQNGANLTADVEPGTIVDASGRRKRSVASA